MNSRIFTNLFLICLVLYSYAMGAYFYLYQYTTYASYLYYGAKGLAGVGYIIILIWCVIKALNKVKNISIFIIFMILLLSIFYSGWSILLGSTIGGAIAVWRQYIFALPFMFLPMIIRTELFIPFVDKFITIFKGFVILNVVFLYLEIMGYLNIPFGIQMSNLNGALDVILGSEGASRYAYTFIGGFPRFFGIMDTAQTFGVVLAIGTAIFIYNFQNYGKLKLALLSILSLFALLLSISKTGIFLLAILVMLMMLFNRERKVIRIYLSIVLLAVTMIVIFSFIEWKSYYNSAVSALGNSEYHGDYLHSLHSTFGYLFDSLPARVGVLGQYYDVTPDHYKSIAPILDTANAAHFGKEDHFEYYWLNWVLNYGWSIFICLIFLFVNVLKTTILTFKETNNYAKKYKIELSLIILGFLIGGLHYNCLSPVTAPFFWCAVGILLTWKEKLYGIQLQSYTGAIPQTK